MKALIRARVVGFLFGSATLFWLPGNLELQAAPKAETKPFEIWHVEDDWQQNHVSAILQSHDGYLWLGTYQGLIRFDGVRCTVFDSASTPGLVNGLITSLYEDEKGVLWVGHRTGHLTRYVGGRFEKVSLNPAWPNGVVEAIASDEHQDLWLLNGNRFLLRLRDGLSLTVPGEASTTRPVSLTRAQDGKLWLVSDGILATLQQGRIVAFQNPEDQPAGCERVFPARDGGIWVLGRDHLRKWKEGQWGTQIEAGGLARPVSVLLETASGTLLAGTFRNGLYVLNAQGGFIHFDRTNGLSQDGVRALCQDHEGNIWIGTHGGLDRLRQPKVQILSPPDNWQGCAVLSFSVQSNGSVWAGTEGAGLYHFNQDKWSVLNKPQQLFNPFVWSVLTTKSDDLYLGTWGGGLLVANSSRTEARVDVGKITEPVAALYEDRKGGLWIGTGTGLHYYKDGKLTRFAEDWQLAQPDVRAIAESREGVLWFGMSGGGLGEWNHGRLKQYRKQDGLSSDFVISLYIDPIEDTLWIGTSDNGLTRFKDGKFRTISAPQGLPSSISHIVDDGEGNLWLGTQHNGILRASKSDLNHCADGLAGSVRCIGYGEAEGLTSPGCTGGFQPGGCKAADGRLWFPTVKGLAIIDPSDVTTNTIPPPVVIEEFLVDGQTFDHLPQGKAASSQLDISPGRYRFEFRYTALSFAAPARVKFRYRLEGLEQDWREAGTKRFAEYNSLPPDTYKFQVVACNNDGLWNETGASLAFTVLPYFWQTWWFKGLSGAGLLTLVGGVARYVTKKKMQKKLAALQLQHALEKERGRIAQDIHDDVGSRLTEILLVGDQAQKSPGNTAKMSAHVQRITNVTREVIENLDALVWTINPRNDSIDKLAAYVYEHAQTFLETACVRCRFDIPNRLPDYPLSSDLRHNLFLVVKEALNNAVKHAECSEVLLRFQINEGLFVITITDNGKGFHPAAHSVSGDGLQNMERRITSIGGQFKLDSAPGRGTSVTVQMQLNGLTTKTLDPDLECRSKLP